ncbi:hypothetical protein RI543_003380 [Arxiozyma heterogenica]|uniref:Uncharacterized protein n=2 Tax=Arxiozyma heterogenica TaxID=278026 RepID=A0AAN7ZSB8_9SACH|nr:hypothetical protein RI543_003380 [Kazachstania heterogenica]
MTDIAEKIPNTNTNNNSSMEVSKEISDSSANNNNNNFNINLLSIQKDTINVRKQCDELESLIVSQLKNNNHSLNQFMKTLKTISHNQNVLENKLEDLMKNQMNTDILVNNINQRLNLISTLINPKNLSNKKTLSAKDINILLSNNFNNNTTITTNNNNKNNNINIVNGLTTSTKRGPGRPRKNQTRYINNTGNANNNNNSSNNMKSLENNQINNLSPINVSLPTGTVQISKSKRYFIDPLDSNSSSMSPLLPLRTSSSNNKSKIITSVSPRKIKTRGKIKNYAEEGEEEEEEEEENNEDNIEEKNKHRNNNTTKQKLASLKDRKLKTEDKRLLIAQDNTAVATTPPKRRRGRPPKLRTVETVLLNTSNQINKENTTNDKLSHSSQQSNFNNDDTTNNIENTTLVDQTILTIDTSNSNISSANNSNMHNPVDENKNNDINSNSNSKIVSVNQDTLTTINNNSHNNNNITPLSIPITKIIPFKPENENERDIINKEKPKDELSNDKLPQENKEQQRKLDRLRDSREKMLTSLKYNDRARAKSFMESNKELLMALKLEERRKRLSSNYEHTLPITSKQLKNEQEDHSTTKPLDQSDLDNSDILTMKKDITTKTTIDTHKLNDATVETWEKKFPGHFPEVSLSNIVNQKLVDDSTVTTPFDDKKTDLLNLLNSDPYFQRNNNDMKKLSNTNANFQTEPVETKIQISGKIPTINDTSLQLNMNNVKVNCPYNLRTKRKLTDPNSTVFPKISQESDTNPTTKKAKISTIENSKQTENKIDLKENNLINKSTDNMKNIEIEVALDNGSISDDSISEDLPFNEPIELVCKDGFFYNKGSDEPITSGDYLSYKFKGKEKDLLAKKSSKDEDGKHGNYTSVTMGSVNKYDRTNVHVLQSAIEQETEFAYRVLSKTTLTESYVNSLEYFIMEFRWENKLVSLGLKLRESKRTWQRRKALFTLFDFWRDQSIEKRNFPNFTMLHAIKEMENYRIFINRSVSWFYNHITLLKMILYDLCDNVDTQWRDWMFPKDKPLPVIGGYDEASKSIITTENINAILDKALVFDLLDDGTENNEIKQSQVVAPNVKSSQET